MSEHSTTRYVDADLTRGELRVLGELSEAAGAALFATAQDVVAAKVSTVIVDLTAVPRMDSLGGAWLTRTAEIFRQAGIRWQLRGEHGQVQEFVRLIHASLATSPPSPPRRPGMFEAVGAAAFAAVAEARDALELLVDMLYWGILAPLTGKGLRWRPFVDELLVIGVRATGLVVLMNVLMGLVIALLSGAQLRQFGASVYVAGLVGIGFARELAPLMTAIIVAARSGAAVAAELATMVVQEEIDALRSMGFNPIRFLVAPKLWAILIALPTLTILAMCAGVAGGMILGVGLFEINPQTWLRQTVESVTLLDVVQGLVKSMVYGATIMFAGCHNGLRVRGGARGVGQATTRAVVMDVVFLVILDMLFALFFEFVVG